VIVTLPSAWSTFTALSTVDLDTPYSAARELITDPDPGTFRSKVQADYHRHPVPRS